MLKRIEFLANVATIVACALAATWFGRELFDARPTATANAASAQRQIYAVGEQLPALSSIDYRQSQQTFLLVVREQCRYCQESIPFYQKLAPAVQRTNGGSRLIVASSDSEEVTRAFLASNNIVADQIVHTSSGALKVPGTPTVIVAAADGTVKHVWVGRLDNVQESAVLATVDSSRKSD